MSKKTEMARKRLLDIIQELDAVQLQLLGVQASLPPGPMELDRFLEMEGADAATGIRAAIACVLRDYLEPAIRDLGALTELSSRGQAGGPGVEET